MAIPVNTLWKLNLLLWRKINQDIDTHPTTFKRKNVGQHLCHYSIWNRLRSWQKLVTASPAHPSKNPTTFPELSASLRNVRKKRIFFLLSVCSLAVWITLKTSLINIHQLLLPQGQWKPSRDSKSASRIIDRTNPVPIAEVLRAAMT